MFANLVLAGYFVVLLPPVVLVESMQAGYPWATFSLFIVASPITRFIFGTYGSRALRVSERATSILFALPSLYLCVLALCLPIAAVQLGNAKVAGGFGIAGFALSLWTVMMFGTFPAHEMLHRRSKAAALAGSVVAGICGYPILGLEHTGHHARPGDSHHPEWARVSESVWHFAGRRMIASVIGAVNGDHAMRASGVWPAFARPLPVGVLATGITASMFFIASGFQGLIVYTCAAVSVFFSMQVMTYVQHWGLGEDSMHDASTRELAWEDDCLMQAWITMNNSFHMAHHRAAEVPYFFVQPSPNAPRQPGCYVVMLHACLVPAVWRRLMLPVLDAFANGRSSVCDPGRRVLCITPSRRLPNSSPTQRGDSETTQ